MGRDRALNTVLDVGCVVTVHGAAWVPTKVASIMTSLFICLTRRTQRRQLIDVFLHICILIADVTDSELSSCGTRNDNCNEEIHENHHVNNYKNNEKCCCNPT